MGECDDDRATGTLAKEVVVVAIDSLLPGRSPRIEAEHRDHARALAELQVPLPPIIVHRPTMRVVDGTHRIGAAKLRGDRDIQVRFFDGSDLAAFVFAVRANLSGGLPLTYADRVAAAARVVIADPTYSDRAIADLTGLSAGTVRSIRQRSVTAGPTGQTRMGRDGRIRPVDGKAARERVREALASEPGASLRHIAKLAGVSPNTVREVRRRLELGEPDRRTPRASGGDPARAGSRRPDVVMEKAFQALSRDPAVRFSESARAAFRWLLAHAVRHREWVGVVERLPPHAAFLLVDVAYQCAAEWYDLAQLLRARTEEP